MLVGKRRKKCAGCGSPVMGGTPLEVRGVGVHLCPKCKKKAMDRRKKRGR